MINLYEIEAKRRELYEALTSEDTAEAQAAADSLAALVEVRDDKLAGCCAWFKNLEADTEAIDLEIERLRNKSTAAKKRAERFNTYLTSCISKGEKWQRGPHSVNYKRCPPSVFVEDEKLVPVQWIREKIEYSVDKEQALKDLKIPGTVIPGLTLETERYKLTVK